MSSQGLKRSLPIDEESSQSPRPRKRPGGASRLTNHDKAVARDVLLKRQQEREQEAKKAAAIRGVHDVVRQHYNAVPQRGRDWRKTESRIKGLRSFNNWVKSTIIHKFSPDASQESGNMLRVLDLGCGKGGDLGKWQQAPQPVELLVGIDPAEISIEQARERYIQMRGRGGRGFRGSSRIFDAEFYAQDAFGETISTLPIIRDVGYDAPHSRRGGGFDVVSMMFCMHYAFESEAKTRGMLQNVSGSLKKGGRFIGAIPSSDIIRAKVKAFYKAEEALQSQKENAVPPPEPDLDPAPEPAPASIEDISTAAHEKDPAQEIKPVAHHEEKKPSEPPPVAEWGNSLYRVRFSGPAPKDGMFRPPFGWKYSFFLEEAVEVPEYVVPWEAFRALAEEYGLELQYRKPFPDVWKEERDHRVFGPLSERMGVRERGGDLLVTEEEMEAAGFYSAFCFYKV